MDSFERKLKLLQKAKFSKKEILSKIESEFGQEKRKIAEEILEKETVNKESSQKNKIIAVSLIAAILILLLFALYYFVFVQFSSFSSSKCNSTPISISGDSIYRQRAFESLVLIENKDCNYLNFISEFTQNINSTSMGFGIKRAAGTYSGGESVNISAFSGDIYFISSVLVHEACHSYQNKHQTSYDEGDCAYTGYNFLKKINASPSLIEATKNIGKTFTEYAFTEENTDVFAEWTKNKQYN